MDVEKLNVAGDLFEVTEWFKLFKDDINFAYNAFNTNEEVQELIEDIHKNSKTDHIMIEVTVYSKSNKMYLRVPHDNFLQQSFYEYLALMTLNETSRRLVEYEDHLYVELFWS